MRKPATKLEKYVCHSRNVLRIALKYGWKPGARYTNLRDVRWVERLGFLDIDWKNYNFNRHLSAAKATRPELTVAQGVTDIKRLPQILKQAEALSEYADRVIVVPKDMRLADGLCERIPRGLLLGYSVPTRYGGTEIPLQAFDSRPVHLLGGEVDPMVRTTGTSVGYAAALGPLEAAAFVQAGGCL